MNEEIGYASAPAALVIETRKSAGMWPAAPAAAAVTLSIDGVTKAPLLFCTAPTAILFWSA